VAGNGKRVKNAETCMSEKINELQPNEATVWGEKDKTETLLRESAEDEVLSRHPGDKKTR
jgi:hypothetical protein